jgi:hypothetical protein
MGIGEIESAACAIAAAVIRNRNLTDAEAAAQMYFECLDVLKAMQKERNAEENRRIL